jgi:multisubunit Na+/H+ antiporter MnhF subunit
MMDTLLNYVIWAAIITHIGMMLVVVWRVWHGENIIDRLIGLDVTTTLMIAILVLISILEKDGLYIDIAIGLAALGAISSIALAKFIADERMF